MTMRPTPATARPAPGEDAVDDLTILYPSSDGEPLSENDFQFTVIIETAAFLRHRYTARPDVYVGGNLLMYYRMNDNQTRVSPDVFAVFGVTDKSPRQSWIVWREGKPPDFVLEVASPGTWRRDGAAKRDIYAEMGVTEYWRFDPTGECFSPPLVGERLGDDGQYHPIPLDTDPNGYLRGRSDILGLDLCASLDGRLRMYDPATGQWLRNHYEEAAAREATEAVLEATKVVLEAESTARQAAEEAQQVEAAARRSGRGGAAGGRGRSSPVAGTAAGFGIRVAPACPGVLPGRELTRPFMVCCLLTSAVGPSAALALFPAIQSWSVRL